MAEGLAAIASCMGTEDAAKTQEKNCSRLLNAAVTLCNYLLCQECNIPVRASVLLYHKQDNKHMLYLTKFGFINITADC